MEHAPSRAPMLGGAHGRFRHLEEMFQRSLDFGEATEHSPANQAEDITPALFYFRAKLFGEMNRKRVEECVLREIEVLWPHAVTGVALT